MIGAYILVKLAPSANLERVSHSLQQPGIVAVDVTLGPWDAFVRCEGSDIADLGRLAKLVRGCPGVVDTLTCPVV